MEVWRTELCHYGVKGMKWGVRKERPRSNGKRRKNNNKYVKIALASALGLTAIGAGLVIYGNNNLKSMGSPYAVKFFADDILSRFGSVLSKNIIADQKSTMGTFNTQDATYSKHRRRVNTWKTTSEFSSGGPRGFNIGPPNL